MKLLAIAASVTAALALLSAGCGGSDEPTDSSSVPFDQSFIDAMVPHHESAIEMAKAAKRAGLSEPVLVDIADAIISTQQDEIDKMTEWRTEWFGVGAIDPDGAEQLGMSAEEMGMQHGGMDFETSDVDAAFAAAMIDHHEGAVAMARLAIERGERQEILTLADAIITAQKTEIEQMMPFASSSDSMDGMGHG